MAKVWEKLGSPVKGRKTAPNLVNVCITFVNPVFKVNAAVSGISEEREGVR